MILDDCLCSLCSSQDEKGDQPMSEMDDMFGDPTGEFPPALAKALTDHPWEYALGLRDGRVIHFSGAELLQGGKWIHLPGPDDKYRCDLSGVDFTFERGIDVRISDIVWVADAPNGS